MERVRCFLKFGEERFLRRLLENKVYFTTAKRCIEYEEKAKKKGVGDHLEAGIGLYNNTTVRLSSQSGSIIMPNFSAVLRFEPAEGIPIYCVFAVDEEFCSDLSGDRFTIKLPDDVREWFSEHYTEHTHVAIIQDPSTFCDDIQSAFPHCVRDFVQYVNKIPGGPGEHPLQCLLDMSHFDGNNGYCTVDDIYKILYKKEKLFQSEHEYRFVLNTEEIAEPEERDVVIHSDIQIVTVDDFWNGMAIKKVRSTP